jgi:GTPase SAR1 family protein
VSLIAAQASKYTLACMFSSGKSFKILTASWFPSVMSLDCQNSLRLVNSHGEQPRLWQGYRGRYSLNIWDVGGQKTIRSYWRNYFEQTDGLVWVVDSSDVRRLDDCRAELHNLLKEEVNCIANHTINCFIFASNSF